MRDVWTVLRKELKELSVVDGGLITSLSFLAFVGLIGVILPLQIGPLWVRATWPVMFWAWMPLFLVTTVTADSFAGERERHTLETLLTTALPDTAILYGKIVAAVGYGYGMLVAVMVVSLITVNAAFGARVGRVLLFETFVSASVLVIGLLVTLFIASIGVMISLKAKTVRQAGQTLSLGILAVLWMPGLVLGYVFRVLPEPQQVALLEWAAQLDGRVAMLALAVLLIILDAVFLTAATRRFKRSCLVLD